jgi:hypothetical protein
MDIKKEYEYFNIRDRSRWAAHQPTIEQKINTLCQTIQEQAQTKLSRRLP